ncbi:MAG: ferredoxin [Pseudomonadota bacterium]
MVTGASFPKIEDITDGALTDAGRVLEQGTIVLLAPGPRFWPIFTQSPEWIERHPDPVDAWSERVISELAVQLGGETMFPFGGPPYQPFLKWAVESGEAFPSPTGPLVHARLGMMISYRGAIRVPYDLGARRQENPCESCADKPCLTACPVSALSEATAYDVPSCYDYLRTEEGQTSCYSAGCAVRRACPISVGAHRDPSQSAYHMTRFLP